MRARAGCFSRDPVRVAGARRDSAVERTGELEVNKGAPAAHEADIFFVKPRRLARQQTRFDRNPSRAQMTRLMPALISASVQGGVRP